jgi:3-hydroxyacyl-CoA dehydrogenase
MGGGIAQIAAVSGLNSLVYDAQPAALEKCKANHTKFLARSVEKGKMTQPDASRRSVTDFKNGGSLGKRFTFGAVSGEK